MSRHPKCYGEPGSQIRTPDTNSEQPCRVLQPQNATNPCLDQTGTESKPVHTLATHQRSDPTAATIIARLGSGQDIHPPDFTNDSYTDLKSLWNHLNRLRIREDLRNTRPTVGQKEKQHGNR